MYIGGNRPNKRITDHFYQPKRPAGWSLSRPHPHPHLATLSSLFYPLALSFYIIPTTYPLTSFSLHLSLSSPNHQAPTLIWSHILPLSPPHPSYCESLSFLLVIPGTHAYMISQAGARKLLQLCPKAVFHVDLDAWRHPSLVIRMFNPMLAYQTFEHSTLADMRDKRKGKLVQRIRVRSSYLHTWITPLFYWISITINSPLSFLPTYKQPSSSWR